MRGWLPAYFRAATQRGSDPVVLVQDFAFQRNPHSGLLQLQKGQFHLITSGALGKTKRNFS